MIKKIKKKYVKNKPNSLSSSYIHYSKLKEYIIDLVKNWYEILWYDWIIINKKGTIWPVSLIFDFSINNKEVIDKYNTIIQSIPDLIKKTKDEWYNLEDLYVDVIFK